MVYLGYMTFVKKTTLFAEMTTLLHIFNKIPKFISYRICYSCYDLKKLDDTCVKFKNDQ